MEIWAAIISGVITGLTLFFGYLKSRDGLRFETIEGKLASVTEDARLCHESQANLKLTLGNQQAVITHMHDRYIESREYILQCLGRMDLIHAIVSRQNATLQKAGLEGEAIQPFEESKKIRVFLDAENVMRTRQMNKELAAELAATGGAA